MKPLQFVTRTLGVAALALTSLAAVAGTVNLKADLKGASEVPAKEVSGTGKVEATFNTDTNEFSYHVVFSGLTGAPVAAHFHGPAGEGVNAKPQIPVKGNPLASPLEGKATLTPDQAKDLLDGKWYFNVHTAANPSGEIRGQVVKAE
jgi:hypothetical protein